MKLISLQVVPKGENGWGSEELLLADGITQVFGPNGSGKTPLVQSLPFCLGYPSKFRRDIYEQCSAARLTIVIADLSIILTRSYLRTEMELTADISDGRKLNFYNEQDFSKFIFELLQLQSRNLVTSDNKIGQCYFSHFLPFFYLDQDIGYNSFYSPISKFIKNQASEVLRMMFGLPAKNEFDAKRALIEVNIELEELDKKIHLSQLRLDTLKSTIQYESSAQERISTEIDEIVTELDRLTKSTSTLDDSVASIDKMINNHISELYNLDSQLAELSQESKGVRSIIEEIQKEINSLSLNESARRLFLSFEEICSSPDCKLFHFSSDSYSKNLLYLKDQIKDLERKIIVNDVKVSDLSNKRSAIVVTLSTLKSQREKATESPEFKNLLTTISILRFRLMTLQKQKDDHLLLNDNQNKHLDLLTDREKILDRKTSLETTRAEPVGILEVRASLRKLFVEWLDVLKTKNVSRDISFVDDFCPIMGEEKIEQLKGSTRTRAVLAFHAALVECLAIFGKLSLPILIFDTPKQHEIESTDLDNFMHRIKKLTIEHSLRVIFSTTEYHYAVETGDIEWLPKYPGKEQLMFLKDPSFSNRNDKLS